MRADQPAPARLARPGRAPGDRPETGRAQALSPLFAAEDLACRRGGRLLFEALAFELAPGDALLLRGPNGSGKSSLLRLLAGFLAPAGGRLLWDGQDVDQDLPAHRARLQFVGLSEALKPLLTVRENLEAAASLLGGKFRIEPALAAFDLADLADTRARFLSTGQRRRAALARLLAAPRRLWLLDEPGSGLDRASRSLLEAAIGLHRAEGGVAVIATHGEVTVPSPLVLDLG